MFELVNIKLESAELSADSLPAMWSHLVAVMVSRSENSENSGKTSRIQMHSLQTDYKRQLNDPIMFTASACTRSFLVSPELQSVDVELDATTFFT